MLTPAATQLTMTSRELNSSDFAMRMHEPCQHRFEPLAKRATEPKHDHPQVGNLTERIERTYRGARHQYEFFGEKRFLMDVRLIDRTRDEGTIELEVGHVGQERGGRGKANL
jgi:hypothetical protein